MLLETLFLQVGLTSQKPPLGTFLDAPVAPLLSLSSVYPHSCLMSFLYTPVCSLYIPLYIPFRRVLSHYFCPSGSVLKSPSMASLRSPLLALVSLLSTYFFLFPSFYPWFWNIFITVLFILYAWVEAHECHGPWVEIRRQLVGIGSLLPACGSHGLNSGCWPWRYLYVLRHLTSLLLRSERFMVFVGVDFLLTYLKISGHL